MTLDMEDSLMIETLLPFNHGHWKVCPGPLAEIVTQWRIDNNSQKIMIIDAFMDFCIVEVGS